MLNHWPWLQWNLRRTRQLHQRAPAPPSPLRQRTWIYHACKTATLHILMHATWILPNWTSRSAANGSRFGRPKPRTLLWEIKAPFSSLVFLFLSYYSNTSIWKFEAFIRDCFGISEWRPLHSVAGLNCSAHWFALVLVPLCIALPPIDGTSIPRRQN